MKVDPLGKHIASTTIEGTEIVGIGASERAATLDLNRQVEKMLLINPTVDGKPATEK